MPELAKQFEPYFTVLPVEKLNERTKIIGVHPDGTTQYLRLPSEYVPENPDEIWDYLDDFDYADDHTKCYLENDFDYGDDGSEGLWLSYCLWYFRPETIGEVIFHCWE